MYTFADGDTMPERAYMRYRIHEAINALEYYCVSEKDEKYYEFTYPWSDETHFAKNPYNYMSVELTENAIYVKGKRYVPVFDFVRHNSRKKIPVFWEDTHTFKRDRMILHDKYYDLAISCGTFAVLCENPAWGMIRNENDYLSSGEVWEEINEIVKGIVSEIKASGIEHDRIEITIIDRNNICDEDGYPSAEVVTLQAKNPKVEKEQLTGDLNVTIETRINAQLIKENLIPPKNKEQFLDFIDCFSYLYFSVNIRHHYKIYCGFLSFSYENGILTTKGKVDGAVSYEYEPLKRFLKGHEPKKVFTTKLPVWGYMPCFERENPYLRLFEMDGIEITRMILEYDGKRFVIK